MEHHGKKLKDCEKNVQIEIFGWFGTPIFSPKRKNTTDLSKSALFCRSGNNIPHVIWVNAIYPIFMFWNFDPKGLGPLPPHTGTRKTLFLSTCQGKISSHFAHQSLSLKTESRNNFVAAQDSSHSALFFRCGTNIPHVI